MPTLFLLIGYKSTPNNSSSIQLTRNSTIYFKPCQKSEGMLRCFQTGLHNFLLIYRLCISFFGTSCIYRIGCGNALQHYLTGCAPVLQGNDCSETCQHALIALTSTDEGKELMTCECEDDLCLQSKQRVEICRSSVTMAMNRTKVSCRIATWICNADALCQTALAYYNRYCKSMFQGRKCTRRCRNSINILTRQEKAAKLNTCQCDGFEEYDCKGIHRNMNLLCFGKIHHGYRDVNVDDDKRNEFIRPNMSLRGDGGQILIDRRLFLLTFIIYYIFKIRQD